MDTKKKDEIMDRLYRMEGLRKVKEEITRMVEYTEFVRLRQEYGFGDRFPSMHLIFTGRPGMGSHTVAGLLGELHAAAGLLGEGKVYRCKRNDLVQDGAAVEEQLARHALQQSAGGILLIERAGELFVPENREDRGVVALSVLYTLLMREQPNVMVILADEEEEINAMLEAMPDLRKVFSKQLCFEDYTPEEMLAITRRKLEKLDYRFTPEAEEKFHKHLQAACLANEVDFTNERYLDELLEEAARQMAKRLMAQQKGRYKKEELMLIEAEDLPSPESGDPRKALEKLKAMTGLDKLKKDIGQHLNYIYFIRERQKRGFSDVMPPLNMIFSGNPGTGKTTVARMLGEIYHASGILERPDVWVQDGRNLLAENGMPPEQIAATLLNSAAGGILYIHQADLLPQTEFGVAVFGELLTNIPTEESGETLVVLGGYPDRITRLLETNPALTQYFPHLFTFEDYTPEELMSIAEEKVKEKNYTFHPKAAETFAALLRKAYDNRNGHFGNVLLVEKILELVIRHMSDRTMRIRRKRELTRQELTTIRREDIPTEIFDLPKFERDGFDEQEIHDVLEELNRLVGQPRIKQQITDFVELARHYSREKTDLDSKMSLHWCLTGNSGMGKRTIAGIIARLYRAMGITPHGRVTEFKVERLLGLTEEEARQALGELLKEAEGGVLLFDEDSPKLNEAAGFRERVHVLLQSQLTEHPGQPYLVYAEPRDYVESLNGGAEQVTEVVNVLVFEDYTHEELMTILKRLLEKENMKLTATARQYMNGFIASLLSTEERSHASSRLIRIVVDMMVRNCLQRVAKTGDKANAVQVISVQKQDVAMFTEPFVSGIMKERKRIGFV